MPKAQKAPEVGTCSHWLNSHFFEVSILSLPLFFVFLWFFDCVFLAMITDELQCNECDDWFLDRVGLKNHKTELHVNEILVGESKFPVYCHCMHSAKLMLPNKRQTSAQDMPLLYQMRQLRSKFHSLSTYTKCRTSASIASRLELQSSTIWTLSSNDSPQHIPTQDKVGSILFRAIVVAVNCHEKDVVLSRDEVESVRALVKNSAVATIWEGITRLFVSNAMPIINNSPLNVKLTDLAAAISQGNKKENEKSERSEIQFLQLNRFFLLVTRISCHASVR